MAAIAARAAAVKARIRHDSDDDDRADSHGSCRPREDTARRKRSDVRHAALRAPSAERGSGKPLAVEDLDADASVMSKRRAPSARIRMHDPDSDSDSDSDSEERPAVPRGGMAGGRRNMIGSCASHTSRAAAPTPIPSRAELRMSLSAGGRSLHGSALLRSIQREDEEEYEDAKPKRSLRFAVSPRKRRLLAARKRANEARAREEENADMDAAQAENEEEQDPEPEALAATKQMHAGADDAAGADTSVIARGRRRTDAGGSRGDAVQREIADLLRGRRDAPHAHAAAPGSLAQMSAVRFRGLRGTARRYSSGSDSAPERPCAQRSVAGPPHGHSLGSDLGLDSSLQAVQARSGRRRWMTKAASSESDSDGGPRDRLAPCFLFCAGTKMYVEAC